MTERNTESQPTPSRTREQVVRKIYPDGEYFGQLNSSQKRHGLGSFRYNDGGVYEGTWMNDMAEGSGAIKLANSDDYVGDFHKNEMHGFGIYNSKSHGGSVYKGSFQNGKPSGHGILTYTSGRKYEGEFQGGYPHGFGVETYSDGSKFEGEFASSVPHGFGTMFSASGEAVHGKWEHGVALQ